MPTAKCWIIVRPDGHAFCGHRDGEAEFTDDESRQRQFPQLSTAQWIIKVHRLAGAKPAEVEREKAG